MISMHLSEVNRDGMRTFEQSRMSMSDSLAWPDPLSSCEGLATPDYMSDGME